MAYDKNKDNNFKVSDNEEVTKLLYEGVHPDQVDKQHLNWKRTWISLSKLNCGGHEYAGLGYYYAVDVSSAKLLRFEELEDAQAADNDKLQWVSVSSWQGYPVDGIDEVSLF